MGLISEVKKIEGAVENEAAKLKADLEAVFGKENADKFITLAKDAIETDAGKIINVFVQAAKQALPNGPGAVLHAIASAGIVPALKAAGLDLGQRAIDTAIQAALAAEL